MSLTGAPRTPVVPAFLAWGDPITDPAASLGQLHFDAVLSEDHERTSEVTDHSVEQGAAIVDHVRPNPDRLSLEVFVSNTPITSPDGQVLPLVLDLPVPDQEGPLAVINGGSTGVALRGLQSLGVIRGTPSSATAQVLQFSADVDYVQNTYNQLTTLKNSATLVSVATPHQFYSNMVIERISMRRDRPGLSAIFHIEMRQIRIVTSSVVDAPLPSIPRAIPTVDKGKQDPKAVPEPKQSVLLHEGLKAGKKIGNGPASNVGAQ